MKILNTILFIILSVLSLEDIRRRELTRHSLGCLYLTVTLMLVVKCNRFVDFLRQIVITVILYVILLIFAVLAEMSGCGSIGGGDLKVIAALKPALPSVILGRGLLIASLLLLPAAFIIKIKRVCPGRPPPGKSRLLHALTPYCNPVVTFPLVPFITMGMLIAFFFEV